MTSPMTSQLEVYPCKRGTNTPLGFHHFQVGPTGVSCCIYCGAIPNLTATVTWGGAA